jgi:cytochrome c oxidase subunit 2
MSSHGLRFGSTSRRISLLLGVVAVAALVALWPHSALAATPRPNWNPGPPWAPVDPKSPEMHMISDLFWIMLAISAVVFFVVFGALLYSIFKFRGGPDAEPPSQIYGNRTIEISWTAIPFVILLVAFTITAKYIHDINSPPKGATPLNIIAKGHQWWWEFDYPSLHVISADEIHVPSNVPLHFHVESADVIHSFWVPQLQRQIDANPGQDNAVFVQMNEPGTYDGDCYEYCGDGHAWMKFRMIVQPRGAFNAWVKHMQSPAAKPTSGLALRGEKVFASHTCIECHSIDGLKGANGTVAPNLTHVGSRWAIAGGAAPVTVSALEQWIRGPSHFKPGALMPPYPLLSNADNRALATYLYSLK